MRVVSLCKNGKLGDVHVPMHVKSCNADTFNPVGLWCQNDVVLTSMLRHHVASKLIRRNFYDMCPPGSIKITILTFQDAR